MVVVVAQVYRCTLVYISQQQQQRPRGREWEREQFYYNAPTVGRLQRAKFSYCSVLGCGGGPASLLAGWLAVVYGNLRVSVVVLVVAAVG